MREGDRYIDRNRLNFAPLSSDNNEMMTGLRFRFEGLSLLILIDPSCTYNQVPLAQHVYRPYYIGFRNQRRLHVIALSWNWVYQPAINGLIFDVRALAPGAQIEDQGRPG
jgi:hypothetical protein